MILKHFVFAAIVTVAMPLLSWSAERPAADAKTSLGNKYCQTDSQDDHLEAVPKSPDYSEPSQWYTSVRSGVADVFYILSTETGDYLLADGTLCHYADTYADSLRASLTSEMEGVDNLIGGKLNFYAPYYRQCSMQSFLSDSLKDARLPLPVGDVRQAFAYYLANENNGRPFVLVGFSQGAMIAMELMREMDDATRSRMVAAYAIGISISQRLLDECPAIRPARRADDTGVTVCYNSVHADSCTIWPRSALCINPVNWRTDSEPATLVTEPSPFIPLDQQQKDSLTVTLDPSSNLLLVDGYTATDYIVPLIGREGNYHSREIWLYRDQLRENMQRRVDSYLSGR